MKIAGNFASMSAMVLDGMVLFPYRYRKREAVSVRNFCISRGDMFSIFGEARTVGVPALCVVSSTFSTGDRDI